jgi:hypothetical protein
MKKRRLKLSILFVMNDNYYFLLEIKHTTIQKMLKEIKQVTRYNVFLNSIYFYLIATGARVE